MSAYRVVEGNLIFPHRGSPPELVKGYKRDRYDPFVLIPDIGNCECRQFVKIKTTCCEKIKLWCHAVPGVVTHEDCLKCIWSPFE